MRYFKKTLSNKKIYSNKIRSLVCHLIQYNLLKIKLIIIISKT